MNPLKSAIVGVFLLCFPVATLSSSEEVRAPSEHDQRRFDQAVARFEIDDETVFDAVARLSNAYQFAISIEYPLTPAATRSLPPPRRFTAHVQGKTLREVLHWLFALDSRYAWSRDGARVNVLPQSRIGDERYLLNRRLAMVRFEDVPDAEKAVFAVLRLVPGKKEKPAVLQIGRKLAFAAPWNATFENLTVREAFNRIAQQLGPSYGWQYTGTEEFQLLTFHEKIQPLPKRDRSD